MEKLLGKKTLLNFSLIVLFYHVSMTLIPWFEFIFPMYIADYILLGLTAAGWILHFAQRETRTRPKAIMIILTAFMVWLVISCVVMTIRYDNDWVSYNFAPSASSPVSPGMNAAVSLLFVFPLGIALAKPDRPVVALDGDSAAMMHLGAMTMVSKVNAPNFLHVVLNNGAHESVGGQPSAGHLVDFTQIAQACGYQTVGRAVTNREELIAAIEQLKRCGKAAFIDCRIHKGLSRKLPPIVFDHREAIDALIDDLNGEN